MKLLIALEDRFVQATDGHIYAWGPIRYDFWRQYLDEFEEVVVLARVSKSNEVVSPDLRADGPCVTFWQLPGYTGPVEYLKQFPHIRREARKAVCFCDCYILRAPGGVSHAAVQALWKHGRAYAVEVVADPWDGLGPNTVTIRFRSFYRSLLTISLKKICRRAIACSYVTQNALQRRYPAGRNSLSIGCSDVNTIDNRLATASAVSKRKKRLWTLINSSRKQTAPPLVLGFVGSMELMYKGADVLLKAFAICRRAGLNAELRLVGDGRSRPLVDKLANELQVADHVQCLGKLRAGEPIFQFLDSIDIFIMPSRTEGLPRALLEAMAR